MEPELIADYECVVGEGPLWHPGERRLYWVDIPTGRMFRYDPATGSHEQFYQGEVVGGFTIQVDGSLLLFMARGAVKIWREGELTTVIEEIPEEHNTRFNDVIADPMGRVFAGTMPAVDHPARLYRLDPDGTLTRVLDGRGLSNGMGFTTDRRGMYWTDTYRLAIYLFDYDQNTGALTNERVFVRIPEGEGLLDGLTVDADGFVWSARWDGGCVIRYAPDGSEERRIRLPAQRVSSMAFGGPDYGDLYITTAGGDNRVENGPGAGALFRVRPGVLGLPDFLSRIHVK
ncbi:MAG: SMP-30/gluconolactonase/LRE family protein [Armatimonadetes bacterium]|nr:SMP-30/gluconolactonase/LRE family protein [Armatimonadota bacterium]